MAVQQLGMAQINPGGRDVFLGLVGQWKSSMTELGVATRASSVTAGQLSGAVVLAATFADWDALGAYNDQIGDSSPAQPLLDALVAEKPPATGLGIAHRNEVAPREADGTARKAFISSLSFDITGNRPAGLEGIGKLRDMFESLGAHSRIFTWATGENQGRVTIDSEFDNPAEWARFRQRLQDHTPASPPMAGLQDTVQGVGLIQTRELPL